jgi:hypothetical protein
MSPSLLEPVPEGGPGPQGAGVGRLHGDLGMGMGMMQGAAAMYAPPAPAPFPMSMGMPQPQLEGAQMHGFMGARPPGQFPGSASTSASSAFRMASMQGFPAHPQAHPG